MFGVKFRLFRRNNQYRHVGCLPIITTITIKKREPEIMTTTEKKEFQLIDSTFTPDDAKNLLSTLITNKINYHKIDDFSNHIRYDRDSGHSRKRIEELLQTKEELTEFIMMAKVKGVDLIVKSRVYLEYTDNVSQ